MRLHLVSLVTAALLLSGVTAAAASAEPPPASDEATSSPMVRGFLRDRDGDFTTVAPRGAAAVKVGGLNDRGDVVGIGYPSPDRNDGGFTFLRDRRGRYATFVAPGTGPESRTVGSDVNNRGQVVGWSDDGRRSFGYVRGRDGRFERIEHPDASGTVPDGRGGEISGTELNGVNDHGDMVGNFGADGTIYGFVRDRWGRYTTIRPPDAAATLLAGINDRGEIVGAYSTVGPDDLLAGNPRGFVYNHGVYRDVTVAGAVGTWVNGINNRGQLAGAYADRDGVTHGFVRDRDGDIETVEHPDAAGLGTAVYAINDKAALTGAYLDTGAHDPDPCDSHRGTTDMGMTAATLAAPGDTVRTPRPDCTDAPNAPTSGSSRTAAAVSKGSTYPETVT
jgi:hypothetical protein